jgi:mannose-6-phosphate isomerase-like protein (cupin superfamily)
MLEDLCRSYKQKAGDDINLVAQFNITDLNESWTVAVQPGQRLGFKKGPHAQAKYLFDTDAETLRQIYTGEMTACTAAGRSGPSEVAPLQLSVAPGHDPHEARSEIFSFLQQFFNRTTPEKVVLAEKHTRKINGAHAIPLYNSTSQKSTWYLLKQGERLNDTGRPSPFPQSFIFIEGEGYAKIGQETVQVKNGESYFVPPNNEHVVWNEDNRPLVMISLAWSEIG